jgi:hyperosmotically inducible protein
MRLHKPARSLICSFVLILACAGPLLRAQTQKRDLNPVHARLAQDVRHKLLMLPNHNLFDNLEFEITGVDTVVLLGQVTRPSLKSDAESALLSMEGVGKIIDKIEVLPLSPADDRIRLAAYHAIFSKPGLERYGIRAVAPIHIIVKDGEITLVGTVANEGDKYLAGIAAKEVPGAYRVVNNLKIEKR